MLIEKGTDKAVYTIRAVLGDEGGILGRFFAALEEAGASIGDITRVTSGVSNTTRDVDVLVDDQEHLDRVLQRIGALTGVRLAGVFNHVEEIHRRGKIRVAPRAPVTTISDIRKVYTPGVANICKLIQADESLVSKYTYVRDTVAIVTNGTAILGLGDIGVRAGLPVMEGKAVLFSTLVGINGIPILVDSREPDVIVDAVARIAKSFGAVKLEDIASPECFEVEDRLAQVLDIPVMHDDQHGTAVVVLASLMNASKYTGTQLQAAKVGIIGLGAAGMGIAKLLMAFGVRAIWGTDLKEPARQRLADLGGQPATLSDVLATADVIISTTGVRDLIKPGMVRPRQVIFALSNPNPEIKPEAALAAGALFAADGRYVNNALGFPGLFRGALDAGARTINHAMKIAAAEAIAGEAEEGDLVPMLLKPGLHERVARRVERAAFESGANLGR